MQYRLPPAAAWLALGLALVGTTGCSKTTPPGLLGTFQVTPAAEQPEHPSGSDQQTFSTSFPVCETGRAKVVWHAFKGEQGAFITSYSVELLESSPGYEVKAVAGAGPERAAGSEAFVRQVNLVVQCYRQSAGGQRTKTAYVSIDARGGGADSVAAR